MSMAVDFDSSFRFGGCQSDLYLLAIWLINLSLTFWWLIALEHRLLLNDLHLSCIWLGIPRLDELREWVEELLVVDEREELIEFLHSYCPSLLLRDSIFQFVLGDLDA